MNLNILKNSSLRNKERKKRSIKERLLEKIEINKNTNCWEWLGFRSKSGHGKIGFRDKVYLTHRISYEIFKSNIPEGLFVCHKCDNPPCINPEHLFVGTQKDNMSDCVNKNRLNPGKMLGEKNPCSKLKNYQVLEIREKIKQGLKLQEIANFYNVSIYAISLIKNKKTYKSVIGE